MMEGANIFHTTSAESRILKSSGYCYSEPPFYMNFLAQTLLSNTIPIPNLVNNLLLTAESLHASNFISFQLKHLNCKIMVTFLLFSKNYLNEEYYTLIIS